MMVGPTLKGGLRIDAEDFQDWIILRYILADAEPAGLAQRLAGTAGAEAEDWEELVMPDLRETFEGQVGEVGRAIELAAKASAGGPGQVFIEKEDAEAWFGALNQARLALHSRYDFSEDEPDMSGMSNARRAAFFRYQFYTEIQILLLKRVLR
ncbi:DUF2017 family protein [Luteolibacter ambystomatis]|uniref:DUF2017 family protein n=1 Tax=Luteolibacter ambystomatis TaxID=2824561 RepID=A0A975G759_9BACT|nr:DUF2017 family protein [Luteolibacter ambystomatis]QUE50334.1 DUF2017 family protein [Luteolibacter ambystomatis]